MGIQRRRLLTNDRGVIFLTTMIALFIMALTATMVYQLTSQSVYLANYLQKSTQARYLAEAGLNHAFAVLRSNFNNWNNAASFPTTALGTGIFRATVSKASSRYLVSSTGTVSGVSRIATAEVKPPPTTASAFDYAISVGGERCDRFRYRPISGYYYG
ncbi:MAG: PilX N-terminal domain-containing pilus assembly protein [Candidatus Omnitrophota bacterium]